MVGDSIAADKHDHDTNHDEVSQYELIRNSMVEPLRRFHFHNIYNVKIWLSFEFWDDISRVPNVLSKA